MKSYLNTSLAEQKRERQALVKHTLVMGIGIAICLVAITLAITSSKPSTTTSQAGNNTPASGLVITPLN